MTTKQISQPVDEAEIKHHDTEGKRSDGYHHPAAQLIVPAARARQEKRRTDGAEQVCHRQLCPTQTKHLNKRIREDRHAHRLARNTEQKTQG